MDLFDGSGSRGCEVKRFHGLRASLVLVERLLIKIPHLGVVAECQEDEGADADQVEPHDSQSLQQHSPRNLPSLVWPTQTHIVFLAPTIEPRGCDNLGHPRLESAFQGTDNACHSQTQSLIAQDVQWQPSLDLASD